MIIYKTTNLINNKFYIGQDSKENPNYYGSGIYLNYAINKYGKENFKKEIIEHCSSHKELNEREIFWIKETKAQKLGYNIANGSQNGIVEETKIKISNTLKGRKHSEESKQKISKALMGNKHTLGMQFPHIWALSYETKLEIKQTYATGKYTRQEVANMFKTNITMVKRCRNLKELDT